jgi:hypothetical protein
MKTNVRHLRQQVAVVRDAQIWSPIVTSSLEGLDVMWSQIVTASDEQ